MNEKQITAMAESATFLALNGIPRNFFYELLIESFKAHEWMEERLGLTEDNNFRVIIPITDNEFDNKDPFVKFVKKICDIKSVESGGTWSMIDKLFIQDEKKNKYKVTRLLGLPLWKKLGKTEVGITLMDMSGKVLCCHGCCLGESPEKSASFIKNFNIWYGEQVKSGVHIVLSSHPLDILSASANASFQSCYRPSGEWFNGVISSMLSSNTLIASVEEVSRPGYKIGRSWIYVNEEMIITGRQYGGITNLHHLYIRSYIYSQVGGSWKHKDKLQICDDIIIMGGPGYLDKGYGSTSLIKAISQDYSKITKIVIPLAMCLFCGTRFRDYGSRGICRTCANTVRPEEIAE